MAQWNPKANEIFLDAFELASAEERRAYLDTACAGDAALRSAVDSLLRAHDSAGSLLERPAPAELTMDQIAPAAPNRAADQPGARVGPYKLLEQIGEGGMGVVFMAEQLEPVRRLVALKIIKPGMDSAQVLARFAAERQALALMDHPNIAKVHDAGATSDGRPYFVMELVKGTPITAFCDASKLTARQRLELFVAVCQAIQHAHQKGVIHRDIKPSNVLIALYDDKPVPKVIDFGVAKAAGQALTEKTLHTGFGAIIGTPEYMSPEQATFNQLDIDTRSDVYSLGVLLYELLTGTTPVDKTRCKEAALLEVLRVVREEEPPRPSVKLSTTAARASIAAARSAEPDRLARELRGELDWIVMKSLEKARQRRYDTAAALGRDVERYLRDEMVEARPPSLGYRLRKSVRKNRGPALTAALVLLALVVGVIGTTVGMVRAWEAEREAEGLTSVALQERDNTEQQRQKASASAIEAHEQRALAADREIEAGKQRDEAKAAQLRLQASQLDLRRMFYVANMNWAGRSWHEMQMSRVRELLEETRPAAGEPDPRGFEWFFLDRLTRPYIAMLDGLGHYVNGVAWSPDGKRLAGSGMKGLIVWDAETHKEIWHWKHSGLYPQRVAFSPDGTHVALNLMTPGKQLGEIASSTVVLFDADTGKETDRLEGGAQSGMGLAFSPDGKRIAAGKHVWDAHSGKKLFTLAPDGLQIRAVAYSPDGRFLATGGSVFQPTVQGEVNLWDAPTGKRLHTFAGLTGVASVAFPPEGRRVAASCDGLLKMWDVETGKEAAPKWPIAAHHGFAFSPDGRVLAATLNYDVWLWDLQTGKCERKFSPGQAHVYSVAFSPDGRQLASGHRYGTVAVWDTGSITTRRAERVGASSIDFYGETRRSADGKMLAISSADVVRVKDADTDQEIRTFKASRSCGVAFSPDDKQLAVALKEPPKPGGADKEWQTVVNVWDIASGKLIRRLEDGDSPNNLRWVAWSPDGKQLAVAGRDVRLWDVDTGKEVYVLHKRGQDIGSSGVAFSPDGTTIAAALSGTVILWDAHGGKEMLSVEVGRWNHFVAFSADGKLLATSYSVLDAATGEKRFDLAAPDINGHYRAAFSQDGKRLVVGDRLTLFDVTSGKEVMRLLTSDEQVLQVLDVFFSRDGRKVIAMCADGPDRTVRVWDATPLPPRAAASGK